MCPKINESANIFFLEIGYASNGALLGPNVGELITRPRESLQILQFAVVQNYTLHKQRVSQYDWPLPIAGGHNRLALSADHNAILSISMR